MTPTNGPPAAGDRAFSYDGNAVRRRGAMLNLSDMWRAAGSPDNRRPADWLALEETGRFQSYAANSSRRLRTGDQPTAETAVCFFSHVAARRSTRVGPLFSPTCFPTPKTARVFLQ